MNKKRKIKAVIVTVIITAFSLCCAGIALTVNDGLYNTDTPTYITLNSTFTGVIENEKDYESYMFEVKEDGIVTLNLEHDNVTSGLDGGFVTTLYRVVKGDETAFYELASFDSFWSDAFTSSGEIGLGKGTYCIVVTVNSEIVTGDFTLTTYFTKTSAYETEINDAEETADGLKENTPRYGVTSQRSSGTDYDWYKITLKEDRAVSLIFKHVDKSLPSVGWNIKLLTTDGKLLAEITSKLSETEVKTGFVGLKAGTYYVKVEGQSVSYEYNIAYTTSDVSGWEIELNDSPETANTLSVNTLISGNLSDRLLGLDKDYYKIKLSKNGYIDIAFSHAVYEGDKNGWNIRVLKKDADGSYYEIVKKISTWNSGGLKISGLGLSAGEYFIVIDADSVSYNSGVYTCKWSFTAKENYEKEPNSIIRRAENINFNELYYGAIISTDSSTYYDEDYFKFELTEETNVCLELGHQKITDSAVYWVASIIDEDGIDEMCRIESSFDDGLASTEVITLPEGVYYIRIQGKYRSEAQYHFRLVR